MRVRKPRRKDIPASLVKDYETTVPWRMQATVAFPYWDCQTRTLEPGTYCRACTYHWEEGKGDDWRSMATMRNLHLPSREAFYRYRAFLEADLPQHFLNCPAVKANYDFRVRMPRVFDVSWDGTDFIVGPKDQVIDT